jgi:transcriptional regulator with XRE-family HTH domain
MVKGKVVTIEGGTRPPVSGALRRAVMASGVSQETIADLAGVSPRHLRRMLSGEAPCLSLRVYLIALEARRAAA